MRFLTVLLALLCVACGSYSSNVPSLKPYKMDIQQGNVVTPKMMMQLRPGMTKSQVRFIMGTPLLVDSFHADRWDYFYQMRKQGKIIEQRRVILEFEGDSLAKVRGDVIPAGSDPAGAEAQVPARMAPKSVTKPPKEKEKGLLDKLKFWGDDENEVPNAAPAEQQKPEAKKEPKPEPKVAPAPVAAPDQEKEQPQQESPLPPLMEEQPQEAAHKEKAQEAPKAEPAKPAEKEEKKGLLDKLKFWGNDDKPQPKAAPAPTTKPVEQLKLEAAKPEPVKPEPARVEPAKVEPKPRAAAPAEPALAPAPKRPSLPDAKPKAPPTPPKDLPPEDAPDFFEKMLEKIGF